MPFKKGQGGRPKGAPNKAPKGSPIQVVCQQLVEDADYRQTFEQRLRAGTMQSGLESMIWHYAYGKPKESVELSGELNLPMKVVFELHRASS